MTEDTVEYESGKIVSAYANKINRFRVQTDEDRIYSLRGVDKPEAADSIYDRDLGISH